MTTLGVTPEMVQGAVSFERRPGTLKPWRLAFQERMLFIPEDAIAGRAETCAGVRLRFATDSPSLVLDVEPADGARFFDLTCDGELLQNFELPTGGTEVAFAGLGEAMRTYELWLPQASPVVLRTLTIEGGGAFDVPQDTRPRWLTYGSSITHCGGAHSPARTWPATAARALGLNLTCLGYGGNCHLEPMIGRMIRDMDADIFTFKLGINVYGASSLGGRTFAPAVVGLVRLVRERHPSAPIGLITSIISPHREVEANAVGYKLPNYRNDLRWAAKQLRAWGDERLRVFEGPELFGEEDLDMLPDNLHPNGDGYEVIGRRAADLVLPVLLDMLDES